MNITSFKMQIIRRCIKTIHGIEQKDTENKADEWGVVDL